jgi:lysozyme family protein
MSLDPASIIAAVSKVFELVLESSAMGILSATGLILLLLTGALAHRAIKSPAGQISTLIRIALFTSLVGGMMCSAAGPGFALFYSENTAQDSNITIPNQSSSGSRIDKTTISAENDQLFGQAVIDPSRMSELEKAVDLIKANKARYQTVETATGVAWFAVALLHFAGTVSDFSVHLNGDPLRSRTIRVPKGPPEGDPPFSWEDSAIDLVRLQARGSDPGSFPTVGVLLFWLEGFDGYGYHSRNVRSPFIWACTNQYMGGKFLPDHVFDPNFKEKKCGAASLLKLLVQRQIFQLP